MGLQKEMKWNNFPIYATIYRPKTTDVIPSGRVESLLQFREQINCVRGRESERESEKEGRGGGEERKGVQVSLREKFHQI